MARSRPHQPSGVLPAPKPITEGTYRHVLGMILSRELPGGTIIQERRMAEALKISRTPLREALGRLEGEGLIVRRSERLLSVRLVSLEEYLHSLEVRLLIEPHAAVLAAAAIPDEKLRHLRALLEAISPDRAHSSDMHWTFDDDLHGTIGTFSGNPLLARTVRGMRRLTKMFERQRLPDRNAPGWQEHEAVLAALEQRDGARAGRAMETHLRMARSSLLESL